MPKTKISDLQKKLDAAAADLKRALADYANLEKRVATERELMEKLALVNLVLKFLPILDNLDKACKHLKDDGVLMVTKQFREVLTSVGVKEVGVVGEKFDPKFHEAVEVVEGGQDGKIVEVLAPGFGIDGQIIRPAKVKVEKVKLEKEAKEKAEKASGFGDYA